MARLETLREHLVPAVQETNPVESTEPEPEEVEAEYTFDDDDFWDAIDLLETSYKTLRMVLMFCDDLSPHRRRLIENHMADIQIFTGEFPLDTKDHEL